MERSNLTKTQEQFWILHKMFPNNTAYNIPSVFRINGIPNIDFLQESLKQLVTRHEILRVNIFEEGNMPFQKVNRDISEFKVEVIKCHTLPDDSTVPEEVITEIHNPFNLKNDNLLRVKLFIFPNNGSFLTFVFHHIIVDLRSKEIFADEFSQVYNSLISGQSVNLGESMFNYLEYAEWQINWLGSPDAGQMLNNWKNELGESVNPITLPTDFDKPQSITLNGERLNFNLDSVLSEKIKLFASENTISPFVVLLSAYSILLSRLTNQQEITIGVPMTNRRHEGSENSLGSYMNIVPIKVNLIEEVNVITLIRQIRQKMMFAHRNQELPLLLLLSQAHYRSNSGINQLFQTGFTFEPPMELKLNGIEIKPVSIERMGAQLELFLIFFEKEGIFHGTFEYSTDHFTRPTIIRWKELLASLIESMIANQDVKTEDLDILPEKEWNLLKKWNDTNTPYEENFYIHKKFESQVKKSPDNIALEFYDQTLTYNELNIHSNRLAYFLLDNGAKVEDRIGICLERSFEMVIAIFATLKAGAVYVPLEPDSPAERMKIISDDAQLKFILTTRLAGKNLNNGSKNIYLDDILERNISEETGNPDTGVNSHNLAYIIYTSGSTGKPKGVMIEHHSVLNKIGWIQKKYPLLSGESMLQKTPITFDVSVWELFWWMFNGGKLDILKPGGERDPKTIVERIQKQKPAVLIFVPSVFSLFLDYLSATRQEKSLAGIRWIVLIGEALPPTLTNKYNKMYEGTRAPVLVNTYGPTEATVAVSWYECPSTTDIKKIYIGKPIDNTKLFVINSHNRLQPIGVPGELVITGVNLARGYQGAPELTSQKFIELPLPDETKTRAYKTGDLAKWDICGELDFIGRADNQVKIRGIRIELGDIESKLLEHPDVNEAAVIVSSVNTENKSLIGYVVLNNGKTGITKEINEFLQKKLPSYMIPTHLVELEKMPLTTSGKINRKLLPAPVFKSNNQFIAPVSGYEKQLADIWKEVLKLDQVSITDNFFESGGDSMLAVSLATRIQQNLDIQVDVIKVMEYPNIKAFATYLAELKKPQKSITESIEERAALRKNNPHFLRPRN